MVLKDAGAPVPWSRCPPAPPGATGRAGTAGPGTRRDRRTGPGTGPDPKKVIREIGAQIFTFSPPLYLLEAPRLHGDHHHHTASG